MKKQRKAYKKRSKKGKLSELFEILNNFHTMWLYSLRRIEEDKNAMSYWN